MEHQFSCYQPSEPMQRYAPVVAQPPVFDRLSAAGNMAVQRSALGSQSASSSIAPPVVDETLRSSAAPLDQPTRSVMESHFGRDFSHVRVHSDDRAAASARAVDASAYTVGQDVVFGAGEYNPQTPRGQQLLAHELTHVAQQGAAARPSGDLQVGPSDDQHEREARQSARAFGQQEHSSASSVTSAGARVQRFDFGDVLDVVTPGAGQAFKNASAGQIAAAGIGAGLSVVSPTAGANWMAWISNPRNQQFLDDLKSSVAESPQHVKEFFVDEVWASIKEHWPQIIAVTVGLLVTEAVIGALAAVPEPTFLTKLVAVILQIVVIAFLVYFAGSEIVDAYNEGRNWFSIASQANGAPMLISDASRSFVRMVWHIVMTVLAVAGLRARIAGFGVPGAAAESGIEEGIGGGTEQGASVTDISSHPKYVPHFDQPSGPVASGGTQTFFGPRGEALKVEPLLHPPPAAPVTAPVAGTAPATTPWTGPGTQPVVGAAAAVSTAQKPKKKPVCGDPELPWTSFTLDGADRGERMRANPLTRCGPPGSAPSIHLPGWNCLQAAPGNETAYWVHAHLLHGLGGGKMDLHGPGGDPRNLILTDKSLNYRMWRDVEALAISLAHIHERTLSYEVTPSHVSDFNDRRYFSDRMNISLNEIDPITRVALRVLYSGTAVSSNQRQIPANCL